MKVRFSIVFQNAHLYWKHVFTWLRNLQNWNCCLAVNGQLYIIVNILQMLNNQAQQNMFLYEQQPQTVKYEL